MQATPPEVIAAYIVSLSLWMAAVAVIWFAGQKWLPLKDFRGRMMRQWQPAVGIAALYAVSVALRGSQANAYSIVLGTIMTFCQALIGLGLAYDIQGFEPLPVVRAITRRERALRSIFLMIGFAALAVAAGLIAGALGTGVARILGEVKSGSQGDTAATPPLWQLFLYFLAGAGLAEELVYRLVVVSLIWNITHRRWVAIIISGLLFGAYHLTPLSGMYLTFWQYPLTQFLSSAFIGMVWATVYIKRGFETAVLAHTLSDWLPIAIFSLVS
jgi:membrane protease YdiL (CAAX protease family)